MYALPLDLPLMTLATALLLAGVYLDDRRAAR